MPKELVILRSYGGQPLVRRIFEIADKVVFVTDDERKDDLVSVGFPREDVFDYDPKLAISIKRLCRGGKWDWKKLKPFHV